jgi:Phage integrase family
MEPDNPRRSWGRISKAAGISGVRFLDIRHTCVSLLLDLKVPPHIVREIVGHSDIEVTMTIYAHASLDEKRAALRKLGGIPRLRTLPSNALFGEIRRGVLAGQMGAGERIRTADRPLTRGSGALRATLDREPRQPVLSA